MVSYRGEMEEGMSLINVFCAGQRKGGKIGGSAQYTPTHCAFSAFLLRRLPFGIFSFPCHIMGPIFFVLQNIRKLGPCSAWGLERREEKDKRDLFPSPQRFPSPFFRAQSELFILPLPSPLPPLAESFSPDNRPGGSVNSSRTFPLQ